MTFKEEVEKLLTTLNHSVEWKTVHDRGVPTLYVDGVDTTMRDICPGARMMGVLDWWRERKMSSDVKKAVAQILDRVDATRASENRRQERNAEMARRDAEIDALQAALGDCGVHVSNQQTLRFSKPLTPALAARIAAAMNGSGPF